jgi:syntaxin 7
MQGFREMATLSPNASSGVDKANQELRAIQFRAVTAFNRLRDDVARLGTSVDTPDLRRRVAGSTHRFGELAQQFRDAVAQHPAKDATATQKIMRDFQGLLKNSERLLSTAREKEAASLPRSSDSAAALQHDSSQTQADIERQALLEQQQKQQLLQTEGELRFNEALIDERDQAITEITGQIGEVHQIFQDLAVLVHDQGEMMDDIESNITRAAAQTQDAHVQIIRAERSQRKARNTWCFLMMLTAGVVAVLLLIILA